MSGYKISFENEAETEATHQAVAGFSLGRLILGLLMAVAAVVASAIAWGLLAYATNSVYFIAALAVGAAVSFTITYPFPRTSTLLAILLFVPAVLLTVTAVLLGDYLYYVLNFMAEGADFAEAAAVVAVYFLELAAEDSLISIVMAVVGTIIGFVNAIRSE